MQKITHSKLVQLLANSNGAMPVGLLTVTNARTKKNPFGAIQKTVRSVGFVGANYENAVKREGKRQGSENAQTFEAKPRPWGVWVIPSKVVTHKGSLYLRTQSTPGQRERNRVKLLNYRGENGRYISREDVKPFLPEKSVSVRQASVGVGKADSSKQIDVREYAFSSIRQIRIAGRTFELIPD